MKKRIIAISMILMLLCASMAGAETTKRERVYAVLDATGEASTIIDNVTLLNDDKLDVINDESALTDIENVGGHEQFTLDGKALTWQAGGNDITYRGTGSAELYVKPAVEMTLDGKALAAADTGDITGRLTIKVNYISENAVPCLAVSALLLDENAATLVKAENSTVIKASQQALLVGWGVPGVSAEAGLPDSFTATFDCAHANLSWMMTVATSAPISSLKDEFADKTAEGLDALDDLRACLDALSAGGDIPEISNKDIYDAFSSLSEMESGAFQLTNGAATLQDGLAQLTANNDTLNGGASQIFDAILATANTQLAASGLDIPELTRENYAEVLDAAMGNLDSDSVKAMAEAAAKEQVTAKVNENKDAVTAAVTEAIKAKVLEGVLEAANVNMSAGVYNLAVKTGKITAEQAAQVSAAVDAQMATDEIKAQLDAAVQAQIESLITENLASDEVQGKITEALAAAQAGLENLTALKAQLDGVSEFVSGLEAYTSGVASAGEGAAQLSDGCALFGDSLKEGLDSLIEKANALLDGDVAAARRVWEEASAALDAADGWDTVPEGMKSDLTFIMRTDFGK